MALCVIKNRYWLFIHWPSLMTSWLWASCHVYQCDQNGIRMVCRFVWAIVKSQISCDIITVEAPARGNEWDARIPTVLRHKLHVLYLRSGSKQGYFRNTLSIDVDLWRLFRQWRPVKRRSYHVIELVAWQQCVHGSVSPSTQSAKSTERITHGRLKVGQNNPFQAHLLDKLEWRIVGTVVVTFVKI